jgi:hypothetical protein
MIGITREMFKLLNIIRKEHDGSNRFNRFEMILKWGRCRYRCFSTAALSPGLGATAKLRIFDEGSGGCGFVSFVLAEVRNAG